MNFNKEQTVLLSLLKEVDSLCRKHKIEYYLSPNLNLCAVTERAFPKDPLCAEVLMKAEDMERFRQIVQDDPGEGRVLESMKSHKWFPGFYLRYENTNTLYVNLDTSRDYAYPSMGVNIYPLRRQSESRVKAKLQTAWEIGWLRRCDAPAARRVGYRARLAGTIVRILCFAGQTKVAAHLYDSFCRNQAKEKSGPYMLRKGGELVPYSERIFESSARIKFAGEEFSVPEKTNAYLEAAFGEDFLEREEKFYVQPVHTIVSARVRGDSFMEHTDELKEYFKERNAMLRKNRKTSRLRSYLMQSWRYAGFCAKRMNLGVDYEKRKEYIKNLYKSEDYLRLEKEFKPYAKAMNKSLKMGELFARDEEIFDIYVDTISKTGKMVQKEKIDKLI